MKEKNPLVKKPRYIVNLTQHDATPEQIAQGVHNIAIAKDYLVASLTFDEIPSIETLRKRAKYIAKLVLPSIVTETEEDGSLLTKSVIEAHEICAMIGGAPFFMPFLERALLERDITPLYAFSKRVSVEETQPDGSVVKKNVFKHEGFVEVL